MRLILIIILTFWSGPVFAANTMTITEADGVAKTNYPVQMGTVFAEGEISDYPKVKLNGTAIQTQAVVKTRHSDGSVRHAILNFLIPSITANQAIAVTFENQTSGNNTALTKTQMLDASYDFDAGIVADFGGGDVDSISARAMLSADDYITWLGGSVATSVILADHSASRAYDFGDDANNSLRPIFHATFWPTINKVEIRYIVEDSSTEVLQDQEYDIELTTGDTTQTSVYTKDAVKQHAGSRWTKSYWLGGDPGNVAIKYNLTYLTSTNEVFSFDLTKTSSSTEIDDEYTSFLAGGTDLYDKGRWDIAMPNSGGRPDLGPYPQWVTSYLYTGNIKAQEMVYKQADLAASWPMHFREGDASKYLDRDSTVPGIGKIMTVSTRPTLFIQPTSYDYSYTSASDKITTVGTATRGTSPLEWEADTAHQPEPFTIAYMASGDFWYLEEAMMWGVWSIASLNGAANNYDYGRGPTGAEGALGGGELRAYAWVFRSRVCLTPLIPDSMPEKSVFSEWINDAIAVEEGRLNITTTGNYGSTLWTWGRNIKSKGRTPPPMHQYDWGGTAFAEAGYGIDTAVTESAISLYEQGYMTVALGRAYQLGYPTKPLLDYVSYYYINTTLNSDYSPYLLMNGRIPVTKVSDSSYFTTWADLFLGYSAERRAILSFDLSDLDHGYDFISNAALAAVGSTDVEDADEAQTWAYNNIGFTSDLNNNPKWALVPFTPNDPIVDLTCADNPSQCADQSTCEAAEWTWCGTYCNATTCPSTPTCDDTPSLCLDSIDCTSAGFNWCTDVCQSASCGGTAPHKQMWSFGGSAVNWVIE